MTKTAGLGLAVASATFWLAWFLMPGVGVTDTAAIFALVSAHRGSVFTSVELQLLSAILYLPASLVLAQQGRASRAAWLGSLLLAIGALGSAADAIFHLVAFEMTAPGVALDAMAPVMVRLQGKDLGLLLPFVAAFFVGHALLAWTFRRRGRLALLGSRLLLAAPVVVVLGGLCAHAGLLPGRLVGLGFLAAVAGSLGLLGVSMASEAWDVS